MIHQSSVTPITGMHAIMQNFKYIIKILHSIISIFIIAFIIMIIVINNPLAALRIRCTQCGQCTASARSAMYYSIRTTWYTRPVLDVLPN